MKPSQAKRVEEPLQKRPSWSRPPVDKTNIPEKDKDLTTISRMIEIKRLSKHLGVCCEIYIFFGKHCLVYWRATSTLAFLQGFLNSLGLDAFCIRGFSLESMRSMISSCYFSVAFFFLTMQQIWYGWHLLCKREGTLASWGKTLRMELTQIFSNWSR